MKYFLSFLSLFIFLTTSIASSPVLADSKLEGRWKMEASDLSSVFQLKAQDLILQQGFMVRQVKNFSLELIGTEYSKRTLKLPVKAIFTVSGVWTYSKPDKLSYRPEELNLSIQLNKNSADYKRQSLHKRQRMLFRIPVLQALAAANLKKNKQKYLSEIQKAMLDVKILKQDKNQLILQYPEGKTLTETRDE